MRTSDSDPLLINPVSLPGTGRIGLTFCPGKKQDHGLTGPWDRDLAADLDRIGEFAPVALVTLMEGAELAGVQAPPELLEAEVTARGMDWYHLPIVDVSVPDETFERRWVLAGSRLRAELRAGKDIVLHCRGGLGRTGTIAGRLLVELGMDAEEAIGAIRAARPGSIETPEQEEHVRKAGVVAEAPDLSERIAGSLVAGAIGDALGAAVEFDDFERIVERFGPEGIRGFEKTYDKIGAVTDDTQMLMFTAEGVIRGFLENPDSTVGEIVRAVWEGYQRWLKTQSEPRDPEARPDGWLLTVPDLWSPRAPGNTCLSSLYSGEMGTTMLPRNNSKGCGGVMRVAPAGLVGSLLDSPEAVFALGSGTAATTHGHPCGYLSAGFLATMLFEIVKGEAFEDALSSAAACLTAQPSNRETFAAIEAGVRTAGEGPPSVAAIEALGGGWVGEEALAIALACSIPADDIKAALLRAVNHGGDSDSTGAVTGNILGALLGARAIPPHLWQKVEMLDPLLRLAEDLALLCGGAPEGWTEEARRRYGVL
jgi:ADP-ribosylglycohydrolase